MSWNEKLKQLGFTEETAPNMVKKAIKELRGFERYLADTEKKLQSGGISERKQQDLEDEAETYRAAIEQQGEVVSRKIDIWNKNKDTYAALGHRLKSNKKQETATATHTSTTSAAPSKTITISANDASKKKKSGAAAVVLFLVLGVLSFGAYNYLKNDK